jgi:hypothetical protein
VSERDVVFISNATPNENEFVRWLGSRLTGHGYKIWADIFDLAGQLEPTVRQRASAGNRCSASNER